MNIQSEVATVCKLADLSINYLLKEYKGYTGVEFHCDQLKTYFKDMKEISIRLDKWEASLQAKKEEQDEVYSIIRQL